jgi:hypothetical protein
VTRRRFAGAGALVIALALVAYGGSLDGPFVFDDGVGIIENRSIRDLGEPGTIVRGSRRPVVNLSFAFNFADGGLEPRGYHVVNLALHLINALLVLALAAALARDRRARLDQPPDGGEELAVGFTAAACFAVHPLLSSSVAYVSGRAGPMCAMWMLASVLAMRAGLRAAGRGRRRALIALALFSYLLALASKETGALLPVIYLLYDRWLAGGDDTARRRRLYTLHVPLFALTLIAGVIRLSSYFQLELGLARPPWQQVLIQAGVFWRYLRLLVAPAGQSVVHPVSELSTPWTPMAWLGLVGLLGLLGLALRHRRRAPVVAFAAVWLLLFLLPSGLVPLLELMSEQRVYEASIGFFLLVGAGAGVLWRRGERDRARDRHAGSLLLLIVALAALTVATRVRVSIWGDPVRLWSEAVARAPDTWAPHYELGNVYRVKGDCHHAIPEYERAIALIPTESRAHLNLGICLIQGGRDEEAGAAFERAVAANPTSPPALANLGLYRMEHGRLDEARGLFLKAIDLQPSYVHGRGLLKLLYEQVGDHQGVLDQCLAIRQIAPATPDVDLCIARARAALATPPR